MELFGLLLQGTIQLYCLFEFAPVVETVLDTGVDKEVEHVELQLGVVLDLFVEEGNNVEQTEAKAAGVELEIGFFLGSNADADFGYCFDVLGVVVEFVGGVNYGDDVFETIVDEADDGGQIVLRLKAVADDGDVLIDLAPLKEPPDQVYVVGGADFQLNTVVKCLLNNVGKVTTLGTIAVGVFTGVSLNAASRSVSTVFRIS
jgi:hypothetical protein